MSLTGTQIEANTARFHNLLTSVKRQGVYEMLDYLDGTDFFDAPASTRFHGSYPGGLCEHSLHVYEAACMLLNICPPSMKTSADVTPDSIIICSLLHDICKVDTYKEEMKWRKVDGNWEQYSAYVFSPGLCFGAHAAESLYTIQKYIFLKWHEAVAICNHMGVYENKDCAQAYEHSQLAWLIHVADEYATYYMDGSADNV